MRKNTHTHAQTHTHTHTAQTHTHRTNTHTHTHTAHTLTLTHTHRTNTHTHTNTNTHLHRPYETVGLNGLRTLSELELCESRGGRPGLPVPNSPEYGLCGRKATLNEESAEFRSCVKVEVAVLALSGRKATLNLNFPTQCAACNRPRVPACRRSPGISPSALCRPTARKPSPGPAPRSR